MFCVFQKDFFTQMIVTLTFNDAPVFSKVMPAQEVKVTVTNKNTEGLFLQIRTPKKVQVF